MNCNEYSFWVIGNRVFNTVYVVILIHITIAAVWKHVLRSLVCKCLFPYNPAWSGTHIRFLTHETRVTLADDSADLENYSCLVTLKTTQYQWFTRLGLRPLILCRLMGILTLQGRKKKNVRPWKCVMLGVNIVLTFNTFLCKKYRDDCLPSQEKSNNIHVAFFFNF